MAGLAAARRRRGEARGVSDMTTRQPYAGPPPVCAHCGSEARRTDGREVYRHRPDLWGLTMWVCGCGARCRGDESGAPIGALATDSDRKARRSLHQGRVAPMLTGLHPASRGRAIDDVHRWIGQRLGLSEAQSNPAHWTRAQCREAWRLLGGQSVESIRAELAQIAE